LSVALQGRISHIPIVSWQYIFILVPYITSRSFGMVFFRILYKKFKHN
jgi:hypothetical protein